MKPPRLSRFKRAAAIPSFDLTERDMAIMGLIERNRFLRSSHIISLLGGSGQNILRRLQLLYHHGYLERPRVQLDYYHRGGSRPVVYGLASKAAGLLQRDTRIAPKSRWSERNRGARRIFLEHALFVSDVMVALELACRASDGIRLLYEKELKAATKGNSLPKPFRWRVKTDGNLKLTVAPDRVFALEFSTSEGARERIFFFLEADRGTMPVTRRTFAQSSFFRKLVAYEATWSHSIHQTRFGFHRFRVLTVTTSAARVQSIIDACSRLKHGKGLFLFAHKSVLEHPEGILSASWKTGAGDSVGLLH